MSKAEFFQEIMPDLKGLAAECLVMDAQDYAEFKCEIMGVCDVRARPFLGAVLSAVDGVIKKSGGGGQRSMIDLISDARIAAKVFTNMRGARAEGKTVRPKMVMQIPMIKSGPAFYDTPEGCMLTHRDKAVHDAVWEVFKELSYEDKRVLCFSPEPGRYLLRVQLWERELEPALPPRQYHKAMGAILHQYVRIKLSDRQKARG